MPDAYPNLLAMSDTELANSIFQIRKALTALERIAHYDLTKMRSGVNVAVLQGIARDALCGDEEIDPGWFGAHGVY